MKKLLVTGSGGLIGSEVCRHFNTLNWIISGIDNNQREFFFGPKGDTTWNVNMLKKEIKNYSHFSIDIRDKAKINDVIREIKPDALVHTAAQPSHDKAAQIPFEDFEINANGTMNILEAIRQHCKECIVVHMSTNKVYGDAPNLIPLKEEKTRWEFDDPDFLNGIPETFSIDQSKHSLFGASKVAADILVQEYGRYFNIPTVCLRGGCLTGPNHSGVELHGFLSYLVKCNLDGKSYSIYGYKGKQVRDNIHSYDVAKFIEEFIKDPKTGAVYNLGGGKNNSCSILEAFSRVQRFSGIEMNYSMTEKNRIGDHICYYSDLTKILNDYPEWRITKSLDDIFKELVDSWRNRLN